MRGDEGGAWRGVEACRGSRVVRGENHLRGAPVVVLLQREEGLRRRPLGHLDDRRHELAHEVVLVQQRRPVAVQEVDDEPLDVRAVVVLRWHRRRGMSAQREPEGAVEAPRGEGQKHLVGHDHQVAVPQRLERRRLGVVLALLQPEDLLELRDLLVRHDCGAGEDDWGRRERSECGGAALGLGAQRGGSGVGGSGGLGKAQGGQGRPLHRTASREGARTGQPSYPPGVGAAAWGAAAKGGIWRGGRAAAWRGKGRRRRTRRVVGVADVEQLAAQREDAVVVAADDREARDREGLGRVALGDDERALVAVLAARLVGVVELRDARDARLAGQRQRRRSWRERARGGGRDGARPGARCQGRAGARARVQAARCTANKRRRPLPW